MPDATSILFLVFLFQIKHLFADFFFQTSKMIAGREAFWHIGRTQHVGIHVLGSCVVMLIWGAGLGLMLALLVAEFIVHFLIDWGKAVHGLRAKHTTADKGYWMAMGTDQALHQATYLVLVWMLV